jgi:hypothetical protein
VREKRKKLECRKTRLGDKEKKNNRVEDQNFVGCNKRVK